MRILLVAEQYRSSRTGTGTYARGIVEGLQAAGHDIELAACRGETPESARFPVLALDTAPGNITALNIRRRGRALERALARESRRFDVVHFLDARWYAPLRNALSDTAVVGTVHDTYALDWLDHGPLRARYRDRLLREVHSAWLRRVERRTYARLDGVLANAACVARALVSGYGISEDRVTVFRVALPRAPVVVAPADLAGSPSVLFVGSNYTRKGLSELLEAAALARREAPGLHVHVVGADPRAERFASAARRLGIGDAVTFHGRRSPDDVLGMMSGCDVFALPSHVEAWGLVYLEAMRCGTPVVATARGGLAEEVTDGEDAFLCPPGDVESLARTLRRLAADAGLRRRIGARGQDAAERFTIDAMTQTTVDAYARALRV